MHLLPCTSFRPAYTSPLCSSPPVRARSGSPDGRRATAYSGVLARLALQKTQLTAEAVTIDGKIITSKGPGTAMEFALTLIDLLSDADSRNAIETALQRG